jgi:putative phosphoesterase
VRVAALADVHGNAPALQAVLAEVAREHVDLIVFGGDLTWGPLPVETLALVRSVGAYFVRGNCDRQPSEYERALLNDEVLGWAAAWPTTVELDGVLYCHATPHDDMRPIITEASPQERFDEALAGIDNALVVAGHTHMQFRRGRWANAGSIGMPYEDDVAAFWAIVSGGEIEFKRTPFDVERAIADIEATEWPDREIFVAENLRVPPSRREAIEQFEAM